MRARAHAFMCECMHVYVGSYVCNHACMYESVCMLMLMVCCDICIHMNDTEYSSESQY